MGKNTKYENVHKGIDLAAPKETWSDDTSMTLGLIDAINKTGNIIPSDIVDDTIYKGRVFIQN